DKTMLDVALPVADELELAAVQGIEPGAGPGAHPVAVVERVARVASAAASATAGLAPRIGRARPLAERSIGTADPGAVSFALAVGVVGEVLARAAASPALIEEPS
ncbi:MAG: DAK2 domain-containing protein, partial [Actinomycetales bacterium]|nr:DAK2 domain-containing protein [Actinomycetales bacterium]